MEEQLGRLGFEEDMAHFVDDRVVTDGNEVQSARVGYGVPVERAGAGVLPLLQPRTMSRCPPWSRLPGSLHTFALRDSTVLSVAQ